jgi:hypothetical protein
MKALYETARFFQAWQFTVSHKQFLLRSTKNTNFKTREEILFKGVKQISVPTEFNGLIIKKPRGTELSSLKEESGLFLESDENFFILETADRKGYIVAETIVFNEDDHDYDEPSPLLSGF